MLNQYIQAAMRKAEYKILDGGEGYFGSIPGYKGVWANADNLEDCRAELAEVLEEWLLFRLQDGQKLPKIDGIELTRFRRVPASQPA
jgi:predicted RNase H-like HicB family nuclease